MILVFNIVTYDMLLPI